MNSRLLAQLARKNDDYSILNSIPIEDRGDILDYLRKLNEPLAHRYLFLSNTYHPYFEQEPLIMSRVLIPPKASDPLLQLALESLLEEFLDYLEEKYFIVPIPRERDLLFNSFQELNYDELFWKFLNEKYDDNTLTFRWDLIKSLYRLKQLIDPLNVKSKILKERIPFFISVEESKFSDRSSSSCLFCGRFSSELIKAVDGFVQAAKQKSQSGKRVDNARICAICALASCLSLARTQRGTGTTKQQTVSLKIATKYEPYHAVFNRLLGFSVGPFLTNMRISNQIDKYGITAVAYLTASTLPKNLFLDDDLIVNTPLITLPLERRKALVIKIFEEYVGYKKMFKPSDESAYRKALFEIIKGNYYNFFAYLARLLPNNKVRRERIIDNGIYEMIKYGVIKMGITLKENPKLIFGMAFLIDAFLPKFVADDTKTETRKVVYYLDKPEEVLYRLRDLGGESTNIQRRFSNEASFKLLKELLGGIYVQGGYGNFSDNIKESEWGESMRVTLDDVLKVYLHIRDKFEEELGGQDSRKIAKEYSDFISRVKYALVARRPELIEKGG